MDIDNSNTRLKHQFYKTDYEKALDVIKLLSEQKVSYQKAYIALFSAVLMVAIGFLRFAAPSDTVEIAGAEFNYETALGLLFIFASALGMVVARNLTSIRVSEVFFNNTIMFLRQEFIKDLNISVNYPNLIQTRCSNRRGADYFSIISASVCNVLFLLPGVYLLFNLQDGFQTILISLLFLGLYLFLHVYFIEQALSSGDRLWRRDIHPASKSVSRHKRDA